MKRVLFYDDVPIYGGHQATAVAAARALAAEGIEVVSAFPAANERLQRAWSTTPARLEPMDLQLTRWQPFLAPFGIAATPVRELLTRVDPDVVIAMQGTIVQSNRVVEQARRLGIRVVSFIPTGLHFPPGQKAQAIVGHLLARFHYRRLHAFITTSAHARGELRAAGVRAPIEIAYYGPALEALQRVPRELARAHLGIDADRYVLVLAGRTTIGTKGHDVMLRALGSLAADTLFLIVGDGPDDARVDALIASLGLERSTRRVPWVNNMSDVYSAADMVVVPSRFEGLPLVVMEAMAFELPVVASAVGAMPEVLPPSWLVPRDDAKALAAAITRARSEDSRALRAANRERVLRELNEEQFGRAFVKALRAVAAAGTNPAHTESARP